MAPRIFYKSVLCCCFCNCNLPFCLFLLFSFPFHFYSLLLVLLSHACAQSWLKIFCFQTDVLWQHLKRAGDLGQWATHVSCIHPALGIPPFYSSVFPDLSFTNCKLSRQGDRQPVQVFFWNRQESQESHWCSGHVRRSTADTLPAFPSPTSSSHLMWSSLIHLPPNCFSSLLALLESWGAHKISLAALEDFSQCWFPKNSAGSSRANSSACYHINSSFMSSVWIIHMFHETKGSFMIPWVYLSPCWSWQTYCFSLLITHQYAVV